MTADSSAPLSGRIHGGPGALVNEEILEPWFRYEADHLLPSYVAIEKVLVLEYLRMELLTEGEAAAIGGLLDEVTADDLIASPDHNMSDIAFAVERHVDGGLAAPVPRWHVDRSRNDLQACAQLMFGRDRIADAAATLADFGRRVHRLAARTAELPMPGYTHQQAAQIITPGFYLAAVSDQVLHALRRLLTTYDGMDRAPLGSGAMAGQELPWDRDRMARLLGFSGPQPHALVGVASRAWVAEVTAEFSLLGTFLSRFVTDLMTWGDNEHRFIDLPDELCGISAAMPQKRNFPVLERIRGGTAHLAAFHVDVVLGQRNTPFTNSVEISKETSRHLVDAFATFGRTLRLLGSVVSELRFDERRMRASCEREYLGGFTLANLLTLNEGVPWRQAQVLSGRYITASMTNGGGSPELLREVAEECGFSIAEPAAALAQAFDVDGGLRRKRSAGSTRPEAVRDLLGVQERRYVESAAEWERRRVRAHDGRAEIERLLPVRPGGGDRAS